MKRYGSWLALVLASLWLAIPPALAQTVSGTAEERLQRLERLLDSQALLKMLESLEALKTEVRDLRGEIELQSHEVGQLKQRQRELYLDVDRRLQHIEVGGSAPQVATTEVQVPASEEATVVDGADSDDSTQAATNSGSESTASTVDSGASGESTVAVAIAGSTGADSLDAGQPTTTPGAISIDPVKEQQDYQAAFNLLKAGRYDDAAGAFREFLDRYQGGQFADNAQYWLGETYYVTRQFEPALGEFQSLIDSHPQSQKLTHAMLKVGYIHHELGRPEQAKQVLTALTERYPQSTAAGLARKRMQRLGSE